MMICGILCHFYFLLELNRLSPDPIIGVFFFVNEPQPDEPEAMEASSLELTVCRLDITLGFAVIRLVGTGLGPTDELTRPKLSSDGNWLTFDEGLEKIIGHINRLTEKLGSF